MAEPKRARKHVRLEWTGTGLEFRAGAVDGPQVLLDGDSKAGPSPMDGLLLSLGACMGSDVRLILEKSRVPLDSLEIEIEGVRAAKDPRRYEEITITYRLTGPGDEHQAKLERAVALSRDTYCSVLHSLRPDIDVEIAIERG